MLWSWMVRSARARIDDERLTGMGLYNSYIGAISAAIARPSAHLSGCITAMRMSHSHHRYSPFTRISGTAQYTHTPTHTLLTILAPGFSAAACSARLCRRHRRAPRKPRSKPLRPIATKYVQVRDSLHASVFITGHHTLLYRLHASPSLRRGAQAE